MMKAMETKAGLRKESALLRRQIKALKSVVKKGVGHEDLILIVEEKKAKLSYLLTLHQWNFNFVSGGWNTNYAYTREESIKAAHKEYKGSKNCEPNEDTFRVATEADTARLMSMFY
jgi:hypothetical protein